MTDLPPKHQMLMRAVTALYLEVPRAIADDVKRISLEACEEAQALTKELDEAREHDAIAMACIGQFEEVAKTAVASLSSLRAEVLEAFDELALSNTILIADLNESKFGALADRLSEAGT